MLIVAFIVILVVSHQTGHDTIRVDGVRSPVGPDDAVQLGAVGHRIHSVGVILPRLSCGRRHVPEL